jgi:hypothetical protein
MHTLILAGESIVTVASNVTSNSTCFITSDGIYPLTAGVTGIANVDVLPDDFSAYTYDYGPNGLVKNGKVIEIVIPKGPVPESITSLQARRALRKAGLLETVNTFIASQSEEIQETWEYAVEIYRNDPTLAMLATSLGLTSDQLDDLFRSAVKIV